MVSQERIKMKGPRTRVLRWSYQFCQEIIRNLREVVAVMEWELAACSWTKCDGFSPWVGATHIIWYWKIGKQNFTSNPTNGQDIFFSLVFFFFPLYLKSSKISILFQSVPLFQEPDLKVSGKKPFLTCLPLFKKTSIHWKFPPISYIDVFQTSIIFTYLYLF